VVIKRRQKDVVVWDMTLFGSGKNRSFWNISRLITLNMEMIRYSETSVLHARPTQHHIPEEDILNCYRLENITEDSGLRSYIVFLYGEAIQDILDEATAHQQ
jgi:hypothetical protein